MSFPKSHQNTNNIVYNGSNSNLSLSRKTNKSTIMELDDASGVKSNGVKESEMFTNGTEAEVNSVTATGVDDDGADEQWHRIERKKKYPKIPRPKPVQGNKEGVMTIRTAKKLSWLFITGFAPDTSQNDVEAYLESQGVNEYGVEKLQTRKDKYKSSFKVSVRADSKDDILKPDFWPLGISVGLFLNLRRRPHMGNEN